VEETIQVALAGAATVRIRMRMTVSTDVVVDATPPVLDTTSSTGGQNVREEVIRSPIEHQPWSPNGGGLSLLQVARDAATANDGSSEPSHEEHVKIS